MRIALAQINPTVGDFSGNLQLITDFFHRAAEQGAELVIFPELATAGYPPGDLLEKESFIRQAEESLHSLAELTRGESKPAMLVGSPMRCRQEGGKHVRNVAAVLEDGELRFTQTKRLLLAVAGALLPGLLRMGTVGGGKRYRRAQRGVENIGCQPLGVIVVGVDRDKSGVQKYSKPELNHGVENHAG